MRVMQVMAGAEKGGAEKFFDRLVLGLHERGLRQHLVIRNHPERRALLEQAGIPVTLAPFYRTFDFLSPFRIRKAASAFNPDLVMTWMSRATLLTPRGNYTYLSRLGGYYDLKYYQKADHLVGNTQGIRDYFLQEKWPASFAHYLPNFVDEPREAAPQSRASFETPEDAPLLLSLGRFHADKAFDVLIRALAQVPAAYLWLGGEGHEGDALRALARRVGVENRIRWIGWQENVTALYQACDLYICPSRIEPLGNVVLEAWAHGKPVIAAKSRGPLELIEDGKNGLLCDLEDFEGLAAGMRDLLENPSKALAIAKEGYQSFKREFTQERVIDTYLDFFNRVKDTRRAR